jgi:NDP-sugar pyrophosphorylase family protein
MFMHYARQLMQSGFGKLKEGYVTLLFNQMVEEGLRVRVVPVERFICWGTPEDLEQYRFWSRYFQVLPASPVKPQNNREQINLIPLAGKGGRFRDYGYRVGKPLIMVRGAPMALSSCKSFPAADKWVFLARGEDLARHPLEKALRSFAPESEVIPVDHDTSGQAATCLLAKSHLSDEASLLITSCDYETLYNAAAWQKLISDESIDAVVWTYRMKSALAKNFQAFAYCQTDKGGTQVSRIVEKKTISETPWLDPLVVGTFWFRRAADFVWCAENAIARNITVNNEHYVGTSMNLLIEQGKKIVIFDIEQWVSFGDPFELNVLNYWEDYFAVKNVSQNYSRPAAAGE